MLEQSGGNVGLGRDHDGTRRQVAGGTGLDPKTASASRGFGAP